MMRISIKTASVMKRRVVARRLLVKIVIFVAFLVLPYVWAGMDINFAVCRVSVCLCALRLV